MKCNLRNGQIKGELPMILLLQVYGIIGALFGLLIAIFARRDQIPNGADTYNFNSGSFSWFVSCVLTWPVVLPAFFVRRTLVLQLRKKIQCPELPWLPTVPKMSYCLIWATWCWLVTLPVYAILLVPMFEKERNDDSEGPVLAAMAIVATLGIGVFSGYVDWLWNRKPTFSRLKGRWFNQTGIGSMFGGAFAGLLLGFTECDPTIASEDGLVAGTFAGGVWGIAVGIFYKYSAFYFRLSIRI